MSEIKMKRTIIALILTLSILFAGSYFLDSYKLNHSLANDLEEISGVKSVKIDKEKVDYKIRLRLKEVDNLQKNFKEIKDRIDEAVEEKYTIILETEDSKELDKIYEQINLVLYEALETGEFVKLGDRINFYANNYQLDRKEVKVDNNYIYLTLVKGKQELYKVVERNQKDKSGGEMNG
ncbi:hypothetical protein [Orenia marismortui]|uniref:Uncharacterized protein n=1 Tax=Orenia marismortui TaxID=46469 RepID=A0A4R8H0H8_9FIRM|nr:hypothetical protein [Orenia marismortui]TDX52922.1 hypothetical protein C7959_10447 [Orenia marismortui]